MPFYTPISTKVHLVPKATFFEVVHFGDLYIPKAPPTGGMGAVATAWQLWYRGGTASQGVNRMDVADRLGGALSFVVECLVVSVRGSSLLWVLSHGISLTTTITRERILP